MGKVTLAGKRPLHPLASDPGKHGPLKHVGMVKMLHFLQGILKDQETIQRMVVVQSVKR